ncbi:MAG TPA: serine/threonine-protein kinase [Anaerolineae bacterium]|nr:serine/threonine-protein kinase [Anaerolineae bacterium]
MRQEEADREFARQAVGEKRLTSAQMEECRGAQMGLADRGIQRALPALTFELGLLPKPVIEQLIRHVIRRVGPIQVGGYDLTQQIGRGGMGIVFKGKQLRMDRTVAVKLLLRSSMTDVMVEKFRHECRLSARLRHHNLVALIESGESDGWHFMAMEHVCGCTLAKLVEEKGPLPEADAVEICAKIADALHHAHQNGIIHRDVKPANVMIGADGEPKLCDLGLAQARDVDETQMKANGLTVGSRRYMSPEQVRGIGHMDLRTDIYSLGLTLFFALTGKPPFRDVHQKYVMLEHLKGQLHWPAEAGAKVSDDVCWTVMRMAAPNPADRYNSAQDLASDLTNLAKRLRERGPREEVSKPLPSILPDARDKDTPGSSVS